jgi:hypothetical protein
LRHCGLVRTSSCLPVGVRYLVADGLGGIVGALVVP